MKSLSAVVLNAVPAYGRKYKSKEDVLRDWNEGLDFRIAGANTYFSRRDSDMIIHNLHADAVEIEFVSYTWLVRESVVINLEGV